MRIRRVSRREPVYRPLRGRGALLHEYAHAVLHEGDIAESERAAREVEAEAVAYLTGRRLGLETERSARYLAA